MLWSELCSLYGAKFVFICGRELLIIILVIENVRVTETGREEMMIYGRHGALGEAPSESLLKVFIVMYHSIGGSASDPYTVSVDNFNQQIIWLVESGFQIIPLRFLIQCLADGDDSRLDRGVVITFDDGYEDFVENALPILLHYRIAATVFLVTDLMGRTASWSHWNRNERLMTEDEVRYIRKQGISTGSHTATHVDLTAVNPVELKGQLDKSRDKLVEFGESFPTLSYPWGRCSGPIGRAAKESGYKCAVAVGGGTVSRGSDIYRLPRIIMRGDMDFSSFRAIFNCKTSPRTVSVWRSPFRKLFPGAHQ